MSSRTYSTLYMLPCLAFTSVVATAATAGDQRYAIDRMDAFAQCVVRGNPDPVRDLLDTPVKSQNEHALLLKLSDKRANCIGRAGKLRMNYQNMRGALAQQLYRRDFQTTGTMTANPKAEFTGRVDFDPIMEYGVCVALRNSPDADALLRTDSNSADEKQALGNLSATLASCLATGQTIRLSPIILRGAVAEALYHQRKGDRFAYVSKEASH
ncbi:hypothetical protein [Sphingobium sp. Ant17]|uniref:hypothetical protein n=1 Tax=Sphingobium sp. Ant17 TaxID=1461752 RepID=UPI00044B5F7A|nr:hypothetical protein [Sphingobium sp. Ant17]EXS68907.1 hypothetical protein BF95_13465 [Sphingobium sp. Ant17]